MSVSVKSTNAKFTCKISSPSVDFLSRTVNGGAASSKQDAVLLAATNIGRAFPCPHTLAHALVWKERKISH